MVELRQVEAPRYFTEGEKMFLRDGEIDGDVSCRFFHRIPGPERGAFMDELYRVMQRDNKAMFVVPWYRSANAYADYMIEWPPVTEASFYYFNRKWREQQGVARDLKCDFDATFGYAMHNAWVMRAEEARAFGSQHYWDVVSELHVTLIKRGE